MKKNLLTVLFLLIFGLSALQAFDIGDRVMADWSGDTYYYPGTVILIEENRYFVIFDDFDREWLDTDLLRPEDIDAGSRVECRWEGDFVYYPGAVRKRVKDAIHVLYDDGDEEFTTIAHIRME